MQLTQQGFLSQVVRKPVTYRYQALEFWSF